MLRMDNREGRCGRNETGTWITVRGGVTGTWISVRGGGGGILRNETRWIQDFSKGGREVREMKDMGTYSPETVSVKPPSVLSGIH